LSLIIATGVDTSKVVLTTVVDNTCTCRSKCLFYVVLSMLRYTSGQSNLT